MGVLAWFELAWRVTHSDADEHRGASCDVFVTLPRSAGDVVEDDLKTTCLTASETFSSLATFHQLARHLVGCVFESLRGPALYCGGLGAVVGANASSDDRPLATALATAAGSGAVSRWTALAGAASGLPVSYPARSAKNGSPSVQSALEGCDVRSWCNEPDVRHARGSPWPGFAKGSDRDPGTRRDHQRRTAPGQDDVGDGLLPERAKTLLGLQFLVAGAREYGEPGVLLTFEESTAKVTANVASLGFDLDALQRDQLLIADAFRVDPAEFGEAGEFDFEPLFILLADSIERIGAKRVVLDTIEVLFGAFQEQAIGASGAPSAVLLARGAVRHRDRDRGA